MISGYIYSFLTPGYFMIKWRYNHVKHQSWYSTLPDDSTIMSVGILSVVFFKLSTKSSAIKSVSLLFILNTFQKQPVSENTRQPKLVLKHFICYWMDCLCIKRFSIMQLYIAPTFQRIKRLCVRIFVFLCNTFKTELSKNKTARLANTE